MVKYVYDFVEGNSDRHDDRGASGGTQMGWGFSRDDVEAAFSRYLDLGIFGRLEAGRAAVTGDGDGSDSR